MPEPHIIRIHESDNVAIVANDGGLAEGVVLPSGLKLRDRVPQGHKVALIDIAAGSPVLRYDVIGLEHTYGCGVAIEAAGSEIPVRTLRHISMNPNFGGEVLVVSLGCEKLQPERLLPPGSLRVIDERQADGGGAGLDVVCLQD